MIDNARVSGVTSGAQAALRVLVIRAATKLLSSLADE
jgi:hypothetical protein